MQPIGERLREVRERLKRDHPEMSARHVSEVLGEGINWMRSREVGRATTTLHDLQRVAPVLRTTIVELTRGTDMDIGIAAEEGRTNAVATSEGSGLDAAAWMRMAQELMAQLRAQDQTQRMRIERVDALNAQANRDLAAAARFAVEATPAPRMDGRQGTGDGPSQEPPTKID